MGTMQEIRNLLADGMTVAEVIAEGYAPSSAYKAAKQLEGNGRAKRRRPSLATLAQPGRRRIVAATPQMSSNDNREEREEELALLREEAEEAERLRTQVGELQARAHHLEQEAQQVTALHMRIASLEGEAQDAARLRERVNGLEAQVQHASRGQVEMSQAAMQWRAKFEAEGASGRHAEQELQKQCQDERTGRMKAEQHAQALKAVVAELEPLRVWAGHPCKVCKRPMSGAVAQEIAAKVMAEFGHKDCLEKDSGSELGWLLGGAAALYGLSQMRKGS